MKKSIFVGLLTIMLAQSMLLPGHAQNANANGGFYKYKQGQLQHPAKSHYRPEIQIIRTDPIVKDFTGEEDPGPTYVIPLPAHKTSSGTGGGANGSDGSGESPYVGRPGTVILKPTKEGRILAPPGFESNMNSLKSPAKTQLQNGSTVGVHGLMKSPTPVPSQNPASPGAKQSISTPVETARYPTQQSTGNASTGNTQQVKTEVKGEMKNKRFGLLNQKR